LVTALDADWTQTRVSHDAGLSGSGEHPGAARALETAYDAGAAGIAPPSSAASG